MNAEAKELTLEEAAAERAEAKERMLARNAARTSHLIARKLLKEGETLEQYDTRIAETK